MQTSGQASSQLGHSDGCHGSVFKNSRMSFDQLLLCSRGIESALSSTTRACMPYLLLRASKAFRHERGRDFPPHKSAVSKFHNNMSILCQTCISCLAFGAADDHAHNSHTGVRTSLIQICCQPLCKVCSNNAKHRWIVNTLELISSGSRNTARRGAARMHVATLGDSWAATSMGRMAVPNWPMTDCSMMLANM